MTAPRPTLGHYRGDSLSHPMLITCVLHIRPEGHRELMLITCVLRIRPEGQQKPRNEVGSLSPAERLVGFEPGTFRFLLQRLNWITLFKVSYVIVKLHNSSHLFKVCLNNAIRPKIIMTITIKIKQIRILKRTLCATGQIFLHNDIVI